MGLRIGVAYIVCTIGAGVDILLQMQCQRRNEKEITIAVEETKSVPNSHGNNTLLHQALGIPFPLDPKIVSSST